MEHRGIYCLAAVTRQNYLKYIENKPLGEKMAKVEVEEPVGNQAIIITESKVGRLEGVYRVYFTYDAIEAAVTLTSKYIHDKYLPEKAISLLESLAVRTSKSEAEHHAITKEDVAAMISDTTGIPVTKVGEAEGRELLNLEERIHAHMIDQVEAVDAVASALRRARAQLSSGKRPIASFLFMGPTGVGKTELAKSVAKVYFEDEDCMIRVDMSEYQNQDSVGKMIGDQRGAKGYLTEAVRQAPFSLLLLDEFEKAHPEILNLFLQVMDDGRLTDGTGRTIDFTNCIIIATSNAGALYIQEQIRAGTQIEKIKEVLINEHLNKIMRPELINRFDGVIVFKPLGETEVVQITKLMLSKTAQTLEAKGIGLRTEEAGILKLAALGYDPKFGARPLRRLLQEKVDNIIANLILAGELKRRDTVVIDGQAEVKVEKGRVL
jgi:ATP-dependent Clp protease ATP-binding subunit ClpA